MATVVLNREIARRFTGGNVQLDVPAETIRGVLNTLDERYPGLKAALRTEMAVAIDGQIYQDALHEKIAPTSEVCFMPAIEGG